MRIIGDIQNLGGWICGNQIGLHITQGISRGRKPIFELEQRGSEEIVFFLFEIHARFLEEIQIIVERLLSGLKSCLDTIVNIGNLISLGNYLKVFFTMLLNRFFN